MINKGVDRELYAVALTPAMRDAILAVLEDPPEGLEDLRGRLARDRERQRWPLTQNVWVFIACLLEWISGPCSEAHVVVVSASGT